LNDSRRNRLFSGSSVRVICWSQRNRYWNIGRRSKVSICCSANKSSIFAIKAASLDNLFHTDVSAWLLSI
jgi:hypothetical protein